jgi:hypothetical protein
VTPAVNNLQALLLMIGSAEDLEQEAGGTRGMMRQEIVGTKVATAIQGGASAEMRQTESNQSRCCRKVKEKLIFQGCECNDLLSALTLTR